MLASVFSAAALAVSGHSALALKPVASGLRSPVYVAAPRSEPAALYIVEQAGRIRRIVGRSRTTFLDLRHQVSCCGERGLLSVAFDPGYAKNRLLYVNYTDRNGDTRVVRYRSTGTQAIPSSARQLLFVEQPFPNHNGGQLQFGPDGLLYVGMGDGGSGGDPGNRAQSLSNRLGKILRYEGGRWSNAVYGVRNPWRFSFDRVTGDLFVADVGQDEWEEVDILPRGFGLTNLGWRIYEGNELFTPGQQPTPGGPLVGPAVVYGHRDGCSITGGYVYRGSAVIAAQGRYFYGDYCSGKVWSFVPSEGKATDLRQEPMHVESLSSFGEDARGELYATSLNGTVY